MIRWVLIVVGLLVLGRASDGAEEIVSPDLLTLGWRPVAFPGRVQTRFIGHEDGAIEIVADKSMSMLRRQVSIDLTATPCLSWRWRVDQAPPPSDLSAAGSDDRPLMVTVAFPGEGARLGLWQRFRHAAFLVVAGHEPPGRVLAYVFGGIGKRGDIVRSPVFGDAGSMRILRPGASPAQMWFDETVNIAAEFKARFGEPLPAPVDVAIFGDSDDSAGRSVARIDRLRFHSACEGAEG